MKKTREARGATSTFYVATWAKRQHLGPPAVSLHSELASDFQLLLPGQLAAKKEPELEPEKLLLHQIHLRVQLSDLAVSAEKFPRCFYPRWYTNFMCCFFSGSFLQIANISIFPAASGLFFQGTALGTFSFLGLFVLPEANQGSQVLQSEALSFIRSSKEMYGSTSESNINFNFNCEKSWAQTRQPKPFLFCSVFHSFSGPRS